MQAMTCPVCQGTTFGNYNGRPQAACTTCRSLERGRLQFLILKHLGLPRPGSRILHVAPEPHLFRLFKECSGKSYHPCDFEVDHPNYRRLNDKIYEIDLCRDIFRFPSNSFDLIVHNHVLEHIPCSVEAVLEEHKRLMAAGAHLIFSVPFRNETTAEDLSPGLTSEERKKLFGQGDHLRIFGTKDFPQLLEKIFGRSLLFDTTVWSDDFLASCGIPPATTRRISGVSNFVYRKPTAS